MWSEENPPPRRNNPKWARAFSWSRLHDHTQTHHIRSDSSGTMISKTQKPLPDNTKYSDIHATGGVRTHSPGKWAVLNSYLIPRGHWNRPGEDLTEGIVYLLLSAAVFSEDSDLLRLDMFRLGYGLGSRAVVEKNEQCSLFKDKPGRKRIPISLVFHTHTNIQIFSCHIMIEHEMGRTCSSHEMA